MHDLDNHLVSNGHVADKFKIFHPEVFDSCFHMDISGEKVSDVTIRFFSGYSDQGVGKTQFLFDKVGRVIKQTEENTLTGQITIYEYQYRNPQKCLLSSLKMVENDTVSMKRFHYRGNLLENIQITNPDLDFKSESIFYYESERLIESIDTTVTPDFKTCFKTHYAYHASGDLWKLVVGDNTVVSYHFYDSQNRPEHYLVLNYAEEVLEWFHFVHETDSINLDKYCLEFDLLRTIDDPPEKILEYLRQSNPMSNLFETKTYLFKENLIKTIHRQTQEEIQITDYSYDQSHLVSKILDTTYTLGKEVKMNYKTAFEYS